MGGGGLASFWEQWNIQILVILSFSLQVILLSSAGVRRRQGSSALLTTLLWLAYLMADYTAIYALGHMSIRMSRSGHQHQIVPFWAPFLLLHLGGPDTITAYAYQDNQLWLRHLLTLAAQVLGAAYVMYLFVSAGRNNPAGTLLAAAALIFVTGCLKYGERTWALKCGGIDSIASSLDDGMSEAARRGPYHGREREERLDSEEVLLGAHYMLNFCKSLLADEPVMQASEYEALRRGIQLNGGKYLFELAAMELSLLYDILYTKAAVIHTWHGFCIRIVSPLSTVAAFVLFLLSSKDAYGRADVAVTYVLLVGAMALELASSLRAAGSSWACAIYHARGWDLLWGTVMRLRRRMLNKQVGTRRRSACLDSLGQYNLLDLCTDANKDDDLRGKIAKMIGLGDRWQKLHYSSTVPISDSVKDLVLGEIRKRRIDDLRNARGRSILKEKGMYEDLTRIADDTELDRSIMVWHIATDLYLSMCPDDDSVEEVRDNIRVLSNHMLFLLVVHPYLLPGVVRSSRYKENLKYYDMVWWIRLRATKEGTKNLSRSEIAKKIFEWQLPADWRHKYKYGIGEEAANDVDDRPIYADGSWLAGMLLGNRWRLPAADMLQVIAGVWVEMMCYASHHCGQESHAKKLSTGGEFMNLVWIIIGHATVYDRFAPSAEALTGGLRISSYPVRKGKLPARWMKPEAEPQSTVVGPRVVPPGVHPAYGPFFDVEAHQTPSTSRADRHNNK